MPSEELDQDQSATEGWYYVRRGEPRGPVTQRYLKALFDNGELGAETLIRGPGVSRWAAAAEVEEPAFVAPTTRESLPDDIPERIALEAAGRSLAVHDEMALADDVEAEIEPLELPELPEIPEIPELPDSVDLSGDAPQDTGTRSESGSQQSSGVVMSEASERLGEALEATPSSVVEADDSRPSGPSPYDLTETGSEGSEPPPSPYEMEHEGPVEEDGLSLDEVLGEVERHREDASDRRRREEIRKASLRLRFEDLVLSTIKPALRKLMQRLHQQGYPTRLRQIDKHHLRFEFTLETSRLIRCRLEIALKPKGLVEFVFLRDLQELSEELVHLDDLDSEKIQAKIAAFVKMSLQR